MNNKNSKENNEINIIEERIKENENVNENYKEDEDEKENKVEGENEDKYEDESEDVILKQKDFGFNDKQIVEKAKRGDKAAFEQLVKLYSKYVYTTAFFMMRDTHDAEDISQEVFVKVYLSISNFRGLSSFKTWIRKLTINTCIDKLRIKAKTSDKKVGLESFEDSFEIIFPSFNHNLEKNFLTRETLKEVLDIIVQMDESYRIPLILRDLQDYSYREIASLINKPIGTVKTNIHRARKIIKEKLLQKIKH